MVKVDKRLIIVSTVSCEAKGYSIATRHCHTLCSVYSDVLCFTMKLTIYYIFILCGIISHREYHSCRMVEVFISFAKVLP